MGRGKETTEFLKECLSDALLRLMKEKPLEKISVGEIIRSAGVSRSTWFRHYACKSEALTFKITQLWKHWADEHGIAIRDRYTLDNANDFWQFNYEIRHTLNTLYAANMQHALYDAFYQIMMPQFDADAGLCYQARFFSYGLFGMLDEWIKRNFKETPTEMVDIFRQAMTEKTDF